MEVTPRRSLWARVRELSLVGVGAVALLVALTAVALAVAPDRPVMGTLVGIAWVAFLAMALGVPLGVRATTEAHPRTLVWGYGIASGAMVTSAAIFLLPQAVAGDVQVGGVGIAAGLLAGFGGHTVGHRFAHADVPFDYAVVALTAHALSAGAILGLVYGATPELSAVLGLAIVSHKGPAGYAAARRRAARGEDVSVLLVPACAVGLTALPAGLVGLPGGPVVVSLGMGFATGVFLHVAMDFLPECEVGGDVYEVACPSTDEHDLLDRLRLHAVASTLSGGLVVVLGWLALA